MTPPASRIILNNLGNNIFNDVDYFAFLSLFTPFPTFPQGGRSNTNLSPLGENERG
jgi:hypothetical protein